MFCYQWERVGTLLFYYPEIKVLWMGPAKWHTASWQLCVYEANRKLVRRFQKRRQQQTSRSAVVHYGQLTNQLTSKVNMLVTSYLDRSSSIITARHPSFVLLQRMHAGWLAPAIVNFPSTSRVNMLLDILSLVMYNSWWPQSSALCSCKHPSSEWDGTFNMVAGPSRNP